VWHAACRRSKEVHTGFWWGSLKDGDHTEDLNIVGRIELKWILKNLERVHTGLI
jgi:hypothetical protein